MNFKNMQLKITLYLTKGKRRKGQTLSSPVMAEKSKGFGIPPTDAGVAPL